VIEIRIQALHQGIGHLNVAGLRNPFQLAQEPFWIRGMFEYVRGNNEVENLVPKWEILDERDHRRAIGDQPSPMALARVFISIGQDIRAKVWIAA